MRARPKPIWIAVTDLRKIVRERRTIAIIILLPIIVVIVVGTTFSLGYQEFERKESAIGVIKHRNSSYAEMIVDAIEDQNAQAIVYETVEDARRDLMREKIDSIIEIDPWIIEKMRELKRSWIAIHADETRPLLTAAIEVIMSRAKQDAVDELVWEYVATMQEEVIPKLNQTLVGLEGMLETGYNDTIIEDALAILGSLEALDDGTIGTMAIVAEEGLNDIMENGTPQEKFIVSMIDSSAIIGTLQGLSSAKPLLDSAYHFLRYVYPHLDDPATLPQDILSNLTSLTANLTRITAEQALLIQAALPLLRGPLVEALESGNPTWTEEEVEEMADATLSGTTRLLEVVQERESELTNLSSTLANASAQLRSLDVKELASEARALLESFAKMEEGFITSPIYLRDEPLYFGEETRRYVDYISPGIFAFGILFSVLVYTVLSVVRDREKGILRRIFVCNVTRWSYVGGKCITCFAIAAIQILILTVCAILIYDIYIVNVPKTLLLGVYSSVGFVGLGLLISSVTKTELEAVTASFGIVFIMLMISGVFYPFELSPSIIRQASAYIPVTYVGDLLKAGIIKDATVSEMFGDLVSVGIYGGVALLIGTLAFRWRKEG